MTRKWRSDWNNFVSNVDTPESGVFRHEGLSYGMSQLSMLGMQRHELSKVIYVSVAYLSYDTNTLTERNVNKLQMIKTSSFKRLVILKLHIFMSCIFENNSALI